MIVVGIDPGREGGVVALTAGRQVIRADRLAYVGREPDLDWLGDWLGEVRPVLVAIEEQGMRPRQGGQGAMMRSHGMLLGLVRARRWALERPPPKTWQQVIGGTQGDDPTAAYVRWVQSAIPGLDLCPGKVRKPHTGLAAAAGIAAWALTRLGRGMVIEARSA